MNFAFRFKQTKPVKFPPSDVTMIQEIATYRAKIFEFDAQECFNGNLEKSLALEQLLINYIALLDEYVQTKSNVEVQFSWNDSYEPNKFIQSNQWHFEYACQLYNLGLLYYHLGLRMPHIKDALTKSRNAQWAFQQIQEVLPFVHSKTVQQQSDLSFVHIHMHYSYTQAYGYKKLFDNFCGQQNQDPLEVLRYLSEAIKLYDQTIRCLMQTKQISDKKIPPIIYNHLMERFTNDSALASVLYDLEAAKILAQTAVEQPKEQKMGKALAHLNRAETTIRKQFKQYKQQSQYLIAQLQQVNVLKKEFEYKNQQIYKNPLAKESELLVVVLKTELVKVKPPEIFQNKYDQKLRQFEDNKKLVIRLIEEINKKKLGAQQKYTQFQTNFFTIMNQYNIRQMLDAFQNAEELKLSPSIKTKVDFIRTRGGWKGCVKQLENIKTLQKEQGRKIINIKSMLEMQTPQQPQQGHFLMQQQLENFKRITEDIQKRLLEASMINHNTEEEIKRQKDQLLFFEQNDNNLIASKFQSSLMSSQQFYKKNLIALKKLAVIFQVFETKFEILKNQLSQIEKYIDELGLDKKQNQEMDQFLYQQVIKKIDEFLAQYDATFQQINLVELEQLASQLQDPCFMNVANQDEEQVEQAMSIIVEQFQNLDYAQQFYESIQDQITQFNQIVEDIMCNK